MRTPLALFAMLAVCALAIPLPAQAQAQYQNRYLNAAMKLYGDLEYESALESLKKAAAQPSNSDAEDIQISVYTGLIQFELGDTSAAESAFKKALALDENVQLPKGVSPKVASAFEKARRDLLKAKPPKPTQTTAPPPATPTTTSTNTQPKPDQTQPTATTTTTSTTTTTTATAVPLTPPTPGGIVVRKEPTGPNIPLALGIGIPLIAVGAGLLGGGGYFGAQMNNEVNSAKDPTTYQSVAQDHLNKAHDDATAANVMFGVGGAVAVAGVVTMIAILASSHNDASVPVTEPLAH